MRIAVPPPPPGAWDGLRAELDLPGDFAPEVLAEASAAAEVRHEAPDRTDLPLLTIDPPGSTDLDQAVHLTRTPDGYLVHYAIADVAAFVAPGGSVDREAHWRGETLYLPDGRVPLHPAVLSEGAASLLPGRVRPALLWELTLDGRGVLVATHVGRALVRSRQRLDYAGVQAQIDGGTADEPLALLAEIGRARLALARARGAVDLPTREQEVDERGLHYRTPVASEAWNAQISLLTGTAAAQLMLDGGVGLLRTLPPPPDATVAALRRSAQALGVAWPEHEPYGSVLSGLDPAVPANAALLALAPRLLRGAAYTAFDGAPPEQVLHSAVAAPYAHCTAPLRRLADRYVGEVCVALCAGKPVPDWARQALPALPVEMAAADHRAHALDRAVVDLAEALVLQGHVGEQYDGVVTEARAGSGTVQLADPAVRGRVVAAGLVAGASVRVRLTAADASRREVRFELAG